MSEGTEEEEGIHFGFTFACFRQTNKKKRDGSATSDAPPHLTPVISHCFSFSLSIHAELPPAEESLR